MNMREETLASKTLPVPERLGSYSPDDVVFLLKDLSDVRLERGTEDREEAIQGGVHYSEMLPVEYRPTPEYLALFHETLETTARKVALAAGIVSERLIARHGTDLVLASLARAGTPIGILMKRYFRIVYGANVPHYSISIIRGKGIDENAVLYMLREHPGRRIQFVDGWTGKGAIRKVLEEARETMSAKYGIELDDDLAVLADPGRCSETFGTREDFLIPSACLNSTVSGLMSRTVLRDDLIGPNDYHGAKYYKEWLEDDVSNLFVDRVSAYFEDVREEARSLAAELEDTPEANRSSWQGMKDIARIQQDYGIADVNLVKPGVGETTRVLLRRVPWKILVDRLDNPNLRHILLLAEDRGVPVEVYPELTYSCCGIIRPLNGGTE